MPRQTTLARTAVPFWVAALALASSSALAAQSVSGTDYALSATIDNEVYRITYYGELLADSLTDRDGTLKAGEYRDLYVFDGRARDLITVELMSDEFDTFLALVSPSGKVIRNDDGPRGSNASITTYLEETGRYRIVATSFLPRERGAYTLLLRNEQIRIAQGLEEPATASVTRLTR